MKYRKDEMEKELERVVNRTKTVEEAVREIIFFFSKTPMKADELAIIEVTNSVDIHEIAWRLESSGKLPNIEIYALNTGADIKTPRIFFIGNKVSQRIFKNEPYFIVWFILSIMQKNVEYFRWMWYNSLRKFL